MNTQIDTLNADYQRNVSEFVSREVFYCVSTLISDLASMEDSDYYDEVLSVLSQDDYIEPALYEASRMDRQEIVDYAENVRGMAFYEDETIEDLLDDQEEAREFCEHFGFDPYQNEALSHWIVSEWLADRLRDKGEMVSDDIHGLTVWGRTTSGQAIAMDSVIQSIYNDLQEQTA